MEEGEDERRGSALADAGEAALDVALQEPAAVVHVLDRVGGGAMNLSLIHI